MAHAESRIQKRHIFQGEEDVAPLVNWLNQKPGDAARERILSILNCFGEAVLNFAETKNLAKLLDDYNGLLSETLSYYTLIPRMLVLARSGKPALSISWVAAPNSELERDSAIVAPARRRSAGKGNGDLPGTQMTEVEALLHVLELVKTRNYWKIAVCLSGRPRPCGRFFFMKFRHQQFCSEKCRLAAFRSSEEARAKRNAYARNLYHLHKTGNVK